MKIRIGNIIKNFFIILITLVFLFICFVFFSGAKGYSVASNSMYPELKKGDAVFVKETPFTQLKNGDIITVSFKKGGGTYTHRISSIDYKNKTVKTKGDSVSDVDRESADENQIVGKVWFSLPFVGYISLLITDKRIVAGIAAFAVILIIVSAIIRNFKNKTKKTRGDSDEQQ